MLKAWQKRYLAHQSLTISERFELFAKRKITFTRSPEAELRIDEWCKNVAKGDKDLFQKRLDVEKIPVNILPLLLGDVADFEFKDSEYIWIEILDKAFSSHSHNKKDFQDIDQSLNDIPFIQILLPLTKVASAKLSEDNNLWNTLSVFK